MPDATQHEGTTRSNQSNRGPESAAYERGADHARGSKAPDQKMATKSVKNSPYGTKKQDDDEDTVGKTQPEDRHMAGNEVVEGGITHVAGLPMETFREMAGMAPIYDIQESQAYYAESVGRGTGQVPTPKATSYTKMPAGYGDQEGGFAQPLHPQNYGHDGADAEMTLDQAIGMLKKEGLDPDYLWSRFLGENNLSIPIVEMLCDEAMNTNDEAMAEELMQLEDAFDHFYESSLVEAYGPEVAEGLLKSIFGKKKAAAAGTPRKAVGTDVTMPGSGGTSQVNLAARMQGQKPKPKMDTSGGAGNIVGKTIKLKPIGGAMPKKASQAPGLPKRLMPKKAMGESDAMSLDADDDGKGNPKMPWDNPTAALSQLASKYGGSKNAGAAA